MEYRKRHLQVCLSAKLSAVARGSATTNVLTFVLSDLSSFNSLALGVKMNILLYLPGLLVLYWKALGPIKMLLNLALIALVQVRFSPIRSAPFV